MKLVAEEHPCESNQINNSCKLEMSKLRENMNHYNELLVAAKDNPQDIVYRHFSQLYILSITERKEVLHSLMINHPATYITWNDGRKIDVYQEILNSLSEEMLLQYSETLKDPFTLFIAFKNIENFPWGKGFIHKMIEKYPEQTSINIGYLNSLKHGPDYIQFIGEKHPYVLIMNIERYHKDDIGMKGLIEKALLSNVKPEIVLNKAKYLIQNGFHDSLKTYLNSQKNLINYVEDYGYGLKSSIDIWKGEPWAKDIILALITRNNNPDPDNYKDIILSSEWAEECINAYIEKNYSDAFNLLNYYKDKPWAKKVLMTSIEKRPGYGFTYYKDIKALPYGDEVFERILETNPYAGMIFLYERLNDRVKFDKYLPSLLIKIQSRINQDIENNSNDKSIYIVRIINMLHEEKGEIRFAILKGVKPENLYRLIVHGRPEVFTSTYNGIVGRIESSGMKIHEILKNVGYIGIHVFFEAVSSYGDLSKILKNTQNNELEKILDVLFSQESSENKIENSVAMFEIIKNIQDSTLLQNIQRRIQDKISNPENSEEWKIIAKYFSSTKSSDAKKEFMIPAFTQLDKKYELPNLSSIKSSEMFQEEIDPIKKESKKINTQQYYFYNDKDGIDSYNHFLEISKASKWNIEDRSTYIILTKSGKNGTIKIYANKPENEKEGGEELKKMNIKPSIVVHRGHSYHAPKTIVEIHDTPKMVFLGSCGGFQNIGGVLRRSPDAHIISTKGVGTMLVNDPLFENINASLLGKETLSWEEIWRNMSPKLKNNENFEKYMRPDKNIGTLFYQRIQSLQTVNNK